MNIIKNLILAGGLGWALLGSGLQAAEVNITAEIESVTVRHGDTDVNIMRNQNQKNTVNPAFAKTSRKCPPFCIHSMSAAPGVVTVGELELLDFLLTEVRDGQGLVVDARTPAWHKKGTIPGSVNPTSRPGWMTSMIWHTTIWTSLRRWGCRRCI